MQYVCTEMAFSYEFMVAGSGILNSKYENKVLVHVHQHRITFLIMALKSFEVKNDQILSINSDYERIFNSNVRKTLLL